MKYHKFKLRVIAYLLKILYQIEEKLFILRFEEYKRVTKESDRKRIERKTNVKIVTKGHV